MRWTGFHIPFVFTKICGVSTMGFGVPPPEVASGWIGFVSLLGLAVVGWIDRIRSSRHATTIEEMRANSRMWEDRCRQCESQRLFEIERHESTAHSLREQVAIAQNNAALLQQQLNEMRGHGDRRESR